MKTTLGEIATIRAGYPFRVGLTPDPDGGIAVVQGRDVDESTHRVSDPQGMVWIAASDVRRTDDHLLSAGDILVMARGPRNYAALVDDGIPPHTVAAGSFHIIRPETRRVVPGFLVWHLNQDDAQTYFRSRNAATTIPMITLDILRSLPLDLPPLAEQSRIAALNDLFERERRLTEIIANRRQSLLRQWVTAQRA